MYLIMTPQKKISTRFVKISLLIDHVRKSFSDHVCFFWIHYVDVFLQDVIAGLSLCRAERNRVCTSHAYKSRLKRPQSFGPVGCKREHNVNIQLIIVECMSCILKCLNN